jgi:hypothetical protein
VPDKVERVESVKYQGAPAHCSLVKPCAIDCSLIRAMTFGVTSNLGLPIGFLLLAFAML